MKRSLVVLGLGMAVLAAVATGQDRGAMWRRVERAAGQGLPKTAIATLDSIVTAALREKDYPDAIRAITQRIAFEGEVQGDHPEEKVRRLQAELVRSPAAMRPVMEAILAHWFREYYERNNWRIAQRSPTAATADSDFTTWDLRRIDAEIDLHFTRALADAPALQRTPIASYDELLERGTAPDAYRPTLYDFLVHDALEFYSAGDQTAAHPEDAFALRPGDPVFAPAAEFTAWSIATADSTSPTWKALRLYQDLLRFHAGRGDTTALLDADLDRLDFARAHAADADKDARYMAAMERLAERYAHYEISARALRAWAGALREQGDLLGARRVARDGLARFPNSMGGHQCSNLIGELEAPSFAIRISDRTWHDAGERIGVTYRNIDHLEFRLYGLEHDRWLGHGPGDPGGLNDAELDSLIRETPVRRWTVGLPPTSDLHERSERLPAPSGLAQGAYRLLAIEGDPGDRARRRVHATEVWASDLALVLRSGDTQGAEGLVLRSGPGDPVADVRIQTWVRKDPPGGYVAGPATRTDAEGRFHLAGVGHEQWLVEADEGRQWVVARGPWVGRPRRPEREEERTLLFTDRAIYRPGQTVQYKGLCIDVDREDNHYATIADRAVTVEFRDPNGKEIDRQDLRTNDVGSFSGSFTAPRDRVMGQMSVVVVTGPGGSASVSVEEYKRPKFSVTLAAPAGPARLEAEVTAVGTATAYTGAPIDGAKVAWRVTRRASYPPWWSWRYWWRPQPATDAQEIAHGVGETDADGHFSVSFTARPTAGAQASDEPVFHYAVHADVTDPNGETRSADRMVSVGYTAFTASLSASEWQVDGRPARVTVSTASLDGEPREAAGELVIDALRQPGAPKRDEGLGGPAGVRQPAGGDGATPAGPDSAGFGPDPGTWPVAREVRRERIQTDSSGVASAAFALAPGYYRARFETRDPFGRAVTAELPLRVLSEHATRCPLQVPDLLAAPSWSVEPGQDFVALWGSGYTHARAYVEVEHRGRLLQAYWTDPGRTQVTVRQAVTEEMRGGFTVRVTAVHENRLYTNSRQVDVPWSSKRLTVRWEHFVSALQPGRRETWTAVISAPTGAAAGAEMVATLYDASLDAFRRLGWPDLAGVFRHESAWMNTELAGGPTALQWIEGDWTGPVYSTWLTYRHFPAGLLDTPYGMGARPMMAMKASEKSSAAVTLQSLEVTSLKEVAVDGQHFRGGRGDEVALQAASPASPGVAGEQPPALDQVVARRNLEETAFFYPRLLADANGEVRMEFTMPEALTRWRFLGFAHDRELRSGLLEGSAVTAKDLMVQPNPPRFLREGDVLEFTVKVTNQAATAQSGRVRLTFADASSGASVDAALGNATPELAFDLRAHASKAYAWRIEVPDGLGVITYKAVAATRTLSDGEEGFLPVLSRRVLVTESLPLPIRGAQTKTFDFARLRLSGVSTTLRSQSLVVQMVSNPAWYAVMALPYLMEFPYECSEQTFNRLYANALARHIAGSDPRIHAVFDRWRATPALDSPLEKNEDLKSVLIEETPWLRQARSESQARRNVGVLFEDNRLDAETAGALERLRQMQLADGAWPWFPGGRADDYLTLYITTGFGRLRHLGVSVPDDLAQRALARLDAWSDRTYREVLRQGHPEQDHLTPMVALYLYGRSFFDRDHPVQPAAHEALQYWLKQGAQYWLALGDRQSQAHVALALQRYGDGATAKAIVRSLRERSVSSGEMGMFWRDTEQSWWWFRAPIESQGMMIEAFDEIAHDSVAVEDCRAWLLKQKQTQDWKTTRATADAVYALLLRGRNLLASTRPVEVSLAGRPVEPAAVEAGTGFYEKRFAGAEITPAMGQVRVTKHDDGVAWGSLHWQYLEDMSKVTPYAGTPLTLEKRLFVRTGGASGPVLEPADRPLRVGDELVVRIVLRSDRDMEYVHLEDYRGSGVEPVEVISGYRFQDGLAYYQETRDVASHFFIDYLPKGTYVFEYAARIQQRGRYQAGMAQIQCMYAPEFNSHSASPVLEVR